MASTPVYKCETAQGVEFSQHPCFENPQLITIKVDSVRNDSSSASKLDSKNTSSKSIDTYIKIKALEKRLAEHQDKINTYKAQMQRQVSVLNIKSEKQPSTLLGAKQSSAFSEQAIAGIARFNVLINNEQTLMGALNQQLNALLKIADNITDAKDSPDQSVDVFIKSQHLKREINQTENKIKTLRDELQENTTNLEGKLIEPVKTKEEIELNSAILKRVEALNIQYNVLLDIEQKKLNRLLNQLSS